MRFAKNAPRHVRGVRWREDTGFEMRCPDCRTYWPLDEEFWLVRQTMQRCKGCEMQRRRLERKTSYYANHEVELQRARDYDTRTRTRRYRECPICGNEIESDRITRAYCNACYAAYERNRRRERAAS